MQYHFTLNKIHGALKAAQNERSDKKIRAYLYLKEALDICNDLGVDLKRQQEMKEAYESILEELGGVEEVHKRKDTFELEEIEEKKRSWFGKWVGTNTVHDALNEAKHLWEEKDRHLGAIATLRKAILTHQTVKIPGGMDRLKKVLADYSLQYSDMLMARHNKELGQLKLFRTKLLRRNRLQEIEESLVMAFKLNPQCPNIRKNLKEVLEILESYDEYEKGCGLMEQGDLSAARILLSGLMEEYSFARVKYEECCAREKEIEDLFLEARSKLEAREWEACRGLVERIERIGKAFKPLTGFKLKLENLCQANELFHKARSSFEAEDLQAAMNHINEALVLDPEFNEYQELKEKIRQSQADSLFSDGEKAEENRNLEMALSSYEKCAEILPTLRNVHQKISRLKEIKEYIGQLLAEGKKEAEMGNLENSVTVLERAVTYPFDFPEVNTLLEENRRILDTAATLFKEGERAADAEDFITAIGKFEEARLLYPRMKGLDETISKMTIEKETQRIIQLVRKEQFKEAWQGIKEFSSTNTQEAENVNKLKEFHAKQVELWLERQMKSLRPEKNISSLIKIIEDIKTYLSPLPSGIRNSMQELEQERRTAEEKLISAQRKIENLEPKEGELLCDQALEINAELKDAHDLKKKIPDYKKGLGKWSDVERHFQAKNYKKAKELIEAATTLNPFLKKKADKTLKEIERLTLLTGNIRITSDDGRSWSIFTSNEISIGRSSGDSGDIRLGLGTISDVDPENGTDRKVRLIRRDNSLYVKDRESMHRVHLNYSDTPIEYEREVPLNAGDCITIGIRAEFVLEHLKSPENDGLVSYRLVLNDPEMTENEIRDYWHDLHEDRKQQHILMGESLLIGQTAQHQFTVGFTGTDYGKNAILLRYSKANGYTVEDFSGNGFLINGKPVTGKKNLRNNDKIGLGNYELVVKEC